MEFLKLVRRNSTASEIAYAGLNIGLAVIVALIVVSTGSVWLALLLVILSKWRVFAVRPRYWWANFQSNLVDFIVSVSVVLYMQSINTALEAGAYRIPALVFMVLFYIAWLLYIKPKSSRNMVATQSLIALFLGSSALFSIAYGLPSIVTVLGMWAIGYTSARHILSSYDDETEVTFLSLASGLMIAEISWVAYHWTVAYSLPVVTEVQIPQVSIILTLLAFAITRAYDSFYHHSKIRSNDILLPTLLTVSVILVLVLLFNQVGEAI